MDAWKAAELVPVSCADARLGFFGHLGTAGAGGTAAPDAEWQQAMALLDEIQADTERTFTYQGKPF